jgi:hypothetical protein
MVEAAGPDGGGGMAEPGRNGGLGGPASPDQVSRRRRAGLASGGLVLLVIVAVVAVALQRGGSSGSGFRVTSPAKRAVLQALDAIQGAGSYDVIFSLHVTPGNGTSTCAPLPVPPGGGQVVGPSVRGLCWGSVPAVDVTGHATVNENPYELAVVTTVSTLGPVSLFVNGTTIWEQGGANYGTNASATGISGPGASLSGFSSLVEGTLGPGQGALAVISYANHDGYLNLEQQAIEQATATGHGSVDGAAVNYYDVTVDVTKLADAPNLTDEERSTLLDAFRVLHQVGYTGTRETVGVDTAGFIREITATSRFSDGSTLVRHTVFSNYGCAAKVSMPNESAPPANTTGPCTSPDTLTPPPSTTTPSSTTTTTTTSSSSTTTTSSKAGS